MARPRKFNEDDVVQMAMMAFWQCGYEATTMKTLSGATGVDARGLSNVFGDKEQLFLRSLKHYHEMYQAGLAHIFQIPSLEAVETFFGQLADDNVPADDPVHNGCLMVNTVIELGKSSEAIHQSVENYRNMFIEHFRSSLRASNISNPEEKAELLLGMLWGALTQIRLSGSKSTAKPMALQILEILRAWRR